MEKLYLDYNSSARVKLLYKRKTLLDKFFYDIINVYTM